jgi:hypothetical protein
MKIEGCRKQTKVRRKIEEKRKNKVEKIEEKCDVCEKEELCRVRIESIR